MAKKDAQKRSYDSPLRRQQQEMTTESIMRAVEELILQGQIHNFTIQKVAKLAGVSYASIYRHFDSREALVQGYRDWTMERFAVPPPYVDSLEELPAWAEQTIPLLSPYFPKARALLTALSVLQIYQVHSRSRERDEWIARLVKEAVPDVPDPIRSSAASIIRLLISMSTWVEFYSRYGLSESEIMLTVKEGIRAQIQYLQSVKRDS